MLNCVKVAGAVHSSVLVTCVLPPSVLPPAYKADDCDAPEADPPCLAVARSATSVQAVPFHDSVSV